MGSPPRLVPQLSVPDSKDIKAMLNRYGYVPEDKPLLPGMFVRAASLEKLVELAIDLFDKDGKPYKEKEEFIRNLHRYRQCDKGVPCKEPNCQHKLTSDKCPRTVIKTKICHTVRYWIRHFPMCFDLNKELSQTVNSLQGLIRQDSHEEDTVDNMADLLDTSKVPSYDWMRNMSVRNPTTKHTSRKVSLVFNNLQPTELAEQLTYMEHKAFRRIT
ncbi:hypothetical protein LSH36_385g02059, partial [Paralvinella palmiformis]